MRAIGDDGGSGATASWLQTLRDLLCDLYEQWGGNCAELGEGAIAWISTVCGTYSAQGAPTFGSSQEKLAFLGTLSTLETHLESPRNTLSSGETTQLTDLIVNLRNDLET